VPQSMQQRDRSLRFNGRPPDSHEHNESKNQDCEPHRGKNEAWIGPQWGYVTLSRMVRDEHTRRNSGDRKECCNAILASAHSHKVNPVGSVSP
jgi:hypothetical protein